MEFIQSQLCQLTPDVVHVHVGVRLPEHMKINDELDAGAHAPEMLDKVGEQEYIVILRAHLVPAGVYAAGTRRPPTVTVIRLQIDLAVRQQLDVQLHNHALGVFIVQIRRMR